MARRLATALVLVLVLAAPASGGLHDEKQQIDARIASLQDRISAARAREDALSAQITSVTAQIRTLERQVGGVSARLATLQHDLALHQVRLARLTALFRLQTRQLDFLKREYAAALERLERRLVHIYETGEPTTIDVMLSARSFTEVLDQLDYLKQIGAQDKRIAGEVAVAKAEARDARARTKRTRAGVATETRAIAVRTDEVAAARERLLTSQHALSTARSRKQSTLATVQETEKEFVDEVDSLQAASGRIEARIQAAQAAAARAAAAAQQQGSPSSSSSTPSPSATPSSSGLIWPVAGPVTSPFGMRWGRMHEGIDIGAATGTPIHAAASGVVIYSGWESGYGNLVVIQHSGNLATAYGHQSSIAVANGAPVSQGQVIGYVGCTGHCFGPHLHFEVRVNGVPVDPLGYL